MSGTQSETKPVGKDQPWWNGLTKEEIVARCPGASIEYKEGEMIVTGRPWSVDAGTLYDTKDGGPAGSDKSGKEQPWWNGLTKEEIVARCPGASIEYKEGEMIVTGRPWSVDAGTLYDTKDGGPAGGNNKGGS